MTELKEFNVQNIVNMQLLKKCSLECIAKYENATIAARNIS